MALFLFQLRESLVSDNYISKGSLSVSDKLANFVSDELLPGLAITPENFWDQLETIIHTFAPKNKELLAKRESIQGQIDQWHLANKDQPFNLELYKTFLKDIDYIVEEGGDFHITTQNVDPEIAMIAGPQLVVPVMNARFALNAANARWGSLYDALYGTDMIGEEDGASRAGAYNPIRGDKVIAFAKSFLDKHFPLKNASFNQVTSLIIEDGSLIARLENGSNTPLMNAEQFQGFQGTLQ